jgi:catechol 2,3-dioxygenase-like lactoylglutathione lyase family enzyme
MAWIPRLRRLPHRMHQSELRGGFTMIFGAHMMIYSKDATADREFFRDVLGFVSVESGLEWLIFELPPAELAVHPAEQNDRHELYFMCADLMAEISALKEKGVVCSDVHMERWGSITKIQLPGGGQVGLYQPAHPTAFALT